MSRPVILCVDDERIILDSLKSQISHTFDGEYAIELAESGEEALEILQELKEDMVDVPVVFVDQIMGGGMYGCELLKHIQPLYPNAKTILLTGQASVEAVGSAFNEAGLFRYISKPWQEDDLVLSLKSALESHSYKLALEVKESHQSALRQILELALAPITYEQQLSQALRIVLLADGFKELRKGAIYTTDVSQIFSENLKCVANFRDAGPDEPEKDLENTDLVISKDVESSQSFYCAPISLSGANVGLLYVYLDKGYEQHVGIKDFLYDVCKSLAGFARLAEYHFSLVNHNKQLEQKVKDRTEQLSQSLETQEKLNNILLSANDKLNYFATIDELTQLQNRRHFFKHANETVANMASAHTNCVLVIIDIDLFKDINDKYGHLAGDVLLQEVAVTMKNCIREHDSLARVGGEEFAILMSFTNLEEAHKLCERLRESVADTEVETNGEVISVTASFGVTDIRVGEQTIEPAFIRADRALYVSKNKGRNMISTFKE